MKFTILIGFVLFALANSVTLNEFENVGNVRAPYLGSDVAAVGITRQNKKPSTIITYPKDGPSSGKYIIRGYQFLDGGGQQLPKIEKIAGGVGDNYVTFIVSSKYPGQTIDAAFLFYGEEFESAKHAMDQAEVERIEKQMKEQKKEGKIAKTFKKIFNAFNFGF